MASLSLHYPNGRSHRMAIPTAVTPGQEFNLHGHRWRVIGLEPSTRGAAARRHVGGSDERAFICRQVVSKQAH